MPKKSHLPNNKQFAFTIFDDTDVATIGNISPVYKLLDSLGFKTTKSVWPFSVEDPKSDYYGSQSLEDPEYCEYIKSLHARGFEIAFHGARMESSPRQIVEKSLKKFYTELDSFPKTYACHAGNRENLYWGENRFDYKLFKTLYMLLNNSKKNFYKGHLPGSPYFWGDLARKHIQYTRTFTFNEINLLNISNNICYQDLAKSFLNYSFISSDADNVEEFNHLIRLENQKKLERQRGICIISTHFGKGFVKNDKVHPETKYLLQCLAQRNGWFPTVSHLLDHIKPPSKKLQITNKEKLILEFKWFLHSIKRKKTSRPYEKSELNYLFPDA